MSQPIEDAGDDLYGWSAVGEMDDLDDDLYGGLAGAAEPAAADDDDDDLYYGGLAGASEPVAAAAKPVAAAAEPVTAAAAEAAAAAAEPVAARTLELDSDSDDDEIQITMASSSNQGQQRLRLRRSVWGDGGTGAAGEAGNGGGAEGTAGTVGGADGGAGAAGGTGDAGLVGTADENQDALRLNPDSYPDDAPLASANGNLFRFNYHRRHTAYDIAMEQIQQRPWLNPGEDLSNYFNYGLTEETWTKYAKEQLVKRNKLSFLLVLEQKGLSRPTAEEIVKLKSEQKIREDAAGGGGSGVGVRGGGAGAGRGAAGGYRGGGMRIPGQMSGKACFTCGQMGHISRMCPKNGGNGMQQRCYVCQQFGHISTQCPNKQGGGRGRPMSGNYSAQRGLSRSRSPPPRR